MGLAIGTRVPIDGTAMATGVAIAVKVRAAACIGVGKPHASVDGSRITQSEKRHCMRPVRVRGEHGTAVGVARALGHTWAWVAWAWRGHGADVVRACPVTPGGRNGAARVRPATARFDSTVRPVFRPRPGRNENGRGPAPGAGRTMAFKETGAGRDAGSVISPTRHQPACTPREHRLTVRDGEAHRAARSAVDKDARGPVTLKHSEALELGWHRLGPEDTPGDAASPAPVSRRSCMESAVTAKVQQLDYKYWLHTLCCSSPSAPRTATDQRQRSLPGISGILWAAPRPQRSLCAGGKRQRARPGHFVGTLTVASP
eukprot:gene24212-biopygen5895